MDDGARARAAAPEDTPEPLAGGPRSGGEAPLRVSRFGGAKTQTSAANKVGAGRPPQQSSAGWSDADRWMQPWDGVAPGPPPAPAQGRPGTAGGGPAGAPAGQTVPRESFLEAAADASRSAAGHAQQPRSLGSSSRLNPDAKVFVPQAPQDPQGGGGCGSRAHPAANAAEERPRREGLAGSVARIFEETRRLQAEVDDAGANPAGRAARPPPGRQSPETGPADSGLIPFDLLACLDAEDPPPPKPQREAAPPPPAPAARAASEAPGAAAANPAATQFAAGIASRFEGAGASRAAPPPPRHSEPPPPAPAWGARGGAGAQASIWGGAGVRGGPPPQAAQAQAHAATPSSPSAEAPALPRRPPPEGSSCEVPDRVHAAQLLDQDLHAEFICRICTDLCQPGDFGLLPCSHIFCRSCLRSYLDWWKRKPQVDCPACRSPFSHAEVGLDETPPEPLVQWLANVAVRCVFAPADELTDDDPLPEGHAARVLEMCCSWRGTVSNYAAHTRDTCKVAAQLREFERLRGREAPSSSGAAGGGAAAEAQSQRTPGGLLQGDRPESMSGDFVATQRWRSEQQWGDGDVALNVEEGDATYIVKVDAQGWAEGVLSDGRRGWLPIAVCKRRVHNATVPFQGDLARGYCGLKAGDRVVVYHREDAEWVYGARLRPVGGAEDARGWFPARSVGPQ